MIRKFLPVAALLLAAPGAFALTRTTVTIPAGAMGNERAMDIVTERWYSSKLSTVVLIERLDPRFGRSVYRLTGLVRTEPAVSMFSVPGKYKILIE